MSVRPALHAVASGRVGEMGKVDVDIGFPSVEALDDIAVTTPTDTTEREITVSLPPGGSIVRATLIAYIVAMNNTANAQKIDVDVKGRKAGGTFSTFFSQDDCIGLVDVEGATVSLMTIQGLERLANFPSSTLSGNVFCQHLCLAPNLGHPLTKHTRLRQISKALGGHGPLGHTAKAMLLQNANPSVMLVHTPHQWI